MKVAQKKGVETIINPAPAIPLPEQAYQGLTHLIVNETEAATLSGIEKPTSWDEVAAIFVARGVRNVIITLGGEVRLVVPFSCSFTNQMVCRAYITKQINDSRNHKLVKLSQQTR